MIVEALRDEYVRDGEFFSASELFDAGRFAPEEQLIYGPIVRLCDEARRIWGRPIPCTAGVRTPAKQQDLQRRGYRTATYSPHVFRCAMDLNVASRKEVYDLVMLLFYVSGKLDIPIRVGYRDYLQDGMSFVHVDCAPLLADELYKAGVIPAHVRDAYASVRLTW